MLPDHVVWSPRQAVIDLHRLSIERFGGSHGIRDDDGIDAALARPQQLAAYQETGLSIFELAAALGYGLVKIRHPFVDGNKRAGWFSMFVFLRLNGYYLDASERAATEAIVGVASGGITEAELADFLARESYAQ
ncbi:MAG: type II toxin-antitoxin system death-on-curing family toxin [Sphingomonadales bacterium]